MDENYLDMLKKAKKDIPTHSGERFEIPPQYGDEDSTFFTRCTNCGFAVKEEGSKNG